MATGRGRGGNGRAGAGTGLRPAGLPTRGAAPSPWPSPLPRRGQEAALSRSRHGRQRPRPPRSRGWWGRYPAAGKGVHAVSGPCPDACALRLRAPGRPGRGSAAAGGAVAAALSAGPGCGTGAVPDSLRLTVSVVFPPEQPGSGAGPGQRLSGLPNLLLSPRASGCSAAGELCRSSGRISAAVSAQSFLWRMPEPLGQQPCAGLSRWRKGRLALLDPAKL